MNAPRLRIRAIAARSWVPTRPTALRLLACALSGTLVFTSVATWDIWPLMWFAFVPMLAAIRGQTPRRAFGYGLATGLVYNIGGFYWIEPMLRRFGHLPLPASLPIALLLWGYQSLICAGFAWSVARVRAWRALPLALIAPLALVAFEHTVPVLFPYYLAISQAWQPPVIQIADLGGPVAVTFLLLVVNGALADLLERRRRAWPSAAAACALVIASLAYGRMRIAQVDALRARAPKVKVGLAQGNVGIRAEAEKQGDPVLDLYEKLSADLERRGAELIVWPESSYPFFYFREQSFDWPAGHPWRVARGVRVPLVINAATISRGGSDPHNSALMIEPDGRIAARFDKNKLLLFGEYVPLYDALRVKQWLPEASNWTAGADVAAFPFRSWRLAPLICYEDIIPSFVRRYQPLSPNLLVNMTNDAWFGRTAEPYEHLALAVFRSVEQRLDLVRAVNTGVSAFVDAAGRVVEKGPSVDPRDTPDAPPATLLGEVAMLDGGSPYATAGDLFGDVDAALLIAAVIAAIVASRGRKA